MIEDEVDAFCLIFQAIFKDRISELVLFLRSYPFEAVRILNERTNQNGAGNSLKQCLNQCESKPRVRPSLGANGEMPHFILDSPLIGRFV